MRKVLISLFLICCALFIGCNGNFIEKAYTDINIESKSSEENPNKTPVPDEGGTIRDAKHKSITTKDEAKSNEAPEVSTPETEKETNAIDVAVEETTDSNQSETNTETTIEIVIDVPEVPFTEVNETVYAISSVNIRDGYSTDCNILGKLNNGDSIQRIGIGDNNWSKVVYNGTEAYVSSKYLSTDKPKSQAEQDIKERGAYGRLTIPDVGINVALFYTDGLSASESQRFVDNSDSAAYIDATAAAGWGRDIIADHKHQGFSGIKNAVNGTKAFIDYGDHIDTYTCISRFNGTNTGSELLDDTGDCIKHGTEGDLIMYTCNENWQNITITYWEKS